MFFGVVSLWVWVWLFGCFVDFLFTEIWLPGFVSLVVWFAVYLWVELFILTTCFVVVS